MTEPEKKQDAAGPPGEDTTSEAVRKKEVQPTRSDLDPTSPREKASTNHPDEVEGCATDTIEDGDGSYLEPPD